MAYFQWEGPICRLLSGIFCRAQWTYTATSEGWTILAAGKTTLSKNDIVAKEAEKKRDKSSAAYHNYEIGSAAFQVAIVLASASIITGVGLLAMVAGGLGVVGVVFACGGGRGGERRKTHVRNSG